VSGGDELRVARVRGLILLAASSAVLGLARWLDPDPTGHGTHTQLGLYPCTFLSLTGLPCPLCGATTTFALLADFRVWEGLVNHPFASFLFVVTVVAWGIGGLEAVAPRGRWMRLTELAERHDLGVAALVLGGLFSGWIYKIAVL
jgi:hypothetical protein